MERFEKQILLMTLDFLILGTPISLFPSLNAITELTFSSFSDHRTDIYSKLNDQDIADLRAYVSKPVLSKVCF